MAGYTRIDPVHDLGIDANGTHTARIARLGDRHFYDRTKRTPAFVGLAKATGGFYAENNSGMTLDAAMRAARMDFEVRFQDTVSVTEMDDHGTTTVTYPHRGTYGIWPDGTTAGMGMVKSRYQLVQPWQAGELGQAIMDEGGANVVAAGIYGNPYGAQTYLAFQLPEGVSIGGESGEDLHDLYMTVLNSYDGSSSMTGLLAPIRQACTNMTTINFGNTKNRFRFRHSGSIDNKLTAAREALGLASEWTEKWQRGAERLLATPMTNTDIDAFLHRVLKTPNTVTTPAGEKGWARKRFEVKHIITQSDTCEFGRGTAYAVMQGVHEWADWFKATKSGGEDGAVTRFTRILDGDVTEDLKIEAATLLLQNR
jgi:phage/plasmid-like protein (TIGR03299 family)